MNSDAKLSASVWAPYESNHPKYVCYPFVERLACSIALIAADILTFAGAQWLFRHDTGVQKIAILPEGGLHPVVVLASIYWLLVVGFVVLRGAMGDYSARRLFWDGAKGTTTGLAIVSIPDLAIALPAAPLTELEAVSCWIFLLVAIPTARQCARALLSMGNTWKIPTAIIGEAPAVSDLFAFLDRSLSLGFKVRWAILKGGDELTEAELRDVVRIGLLDPERIVGYLVAAGCREAIMAGGVDSSDVCRLVRRLDESGISVAVMPAIHLLPPGGANANCSLGRDMLLPYRTNGAQLTPSRIAKRAFDIAASTCLLVVLSPLFLVISAAIKRADAGPVTYAHIRVGKNGVLFRCLKFRTMVTDAESKLAEWQISNPELHEQFLQTFKLKDDPRITPIGRWLRRTSLDELPQLWNVLKGQMSLVGPRPVIIQELDQHYGSAASLYLRVRPGLTGLWQISGRNEIGYSQRVLLDEWYVLNWSFWNDIVILIQTVRVVLSGKGAL